MVTTCPGCGAPLPDGGTCTACGFRSATPDAVGVFAPAAGVTEAGYDPAFYAELARLEDHNWWFRARNRLVVHALRKHFPACRTFLEIGCGTGQVLKAVGDAFPSIRLAGSELFVEGLAFARERVPGARLMQMDATRIPFNGEYDVIGAFDVVEHVADDVRVLANVHRALVPGGGAIFTVPQHPWLWSHQDELAHHQRRYRRGELERKLRDCGFRIAHSSSFVTLLLPLLVLSRLATRRDEDPFRELRIGRAANALLAGVSALEYLLLRAGARLPAGGSRLVVARRIP